MTRRRPRPRRGDAPAPTDVSVDRVGGQGDGIANFEGGRLFIPGVLPGERVRARPEPASKRSGGAQRARLEAILEPSPDRVDPPCPHFGACGGCALQHMADTSYRVWKRDLVVTALGRVGIEDGPVAPVIATPPGSRRRMSVVAHRSRNGIALGFRGRADHRVVDIGAVCPILAPELRDLLAPLRAFADELLGEHGSLRFAANLTDSGADVVVIRNGDLGLRERERFAGFAEAADLARISWQVEGETEVVAQRRTVLQDFGGTSVALPPGAFLQPSVEGEAALVAFVLSALDGATRTADLFAGCGTLSFPMAAMAPVHAVESDEAALGALGTAANRGDLAGRVTVEARDLARRPLAGKELAAFDAAAFDPPRAGAREQAEALAASTVGTVIAISCNPSTFARDARSLVDGGYRLIQVQPIDQFLWSAHVELAAVFRRDGDG